MREARRAVERAARKFGTKKLVEVMASGDSVKARAVVGFLWARVKVEKDTGQTGLREFINEGGVGVMARRVVGMTEAKDGDAVWRAVGLLAEAIHEEGNTATELVEYCGDFVRLAEMSGEIRAAFLQLAKNLFCNEMPGTDVVRSMCLVLISELDE